MKLSKLTLACLLATSGLSVTSVTNAAVTDGLEFHGSFRSGVVLSAEKDFKRPLWAGATKEKLGRLGIEGDNDINFSLVKKWDFDDGKSIRVTMGVAGTGLNKAAASGVDAGGVENSMGFGQTFIELGGITETGTLWAGKRDYGKDNYIFMTDFFYTQMSGLGIGVSDYEVGDTKFDFAYMTSNISNNDAKTPQVKPWDDNTNNIMHSVHVGANFGSFELHGQVKAMPDNWDGEGTDAVEYAETGFDMTAIYHMDSFFYVPGNGFAKAIVQAGQGLGAKGLLGGTLNVYNGYGPGGSWAPQWLSFVDEDDQSARLLLWGGYFLDNGISIFPSVQAQYNDLDSGESNYWMSAMVRSTFPVANNFVIATDLGTEYNNSEDAAGNEISSNNFKATVAPTWVIGTGSGPAPEIRLLATYLNHAGYLDDSDSDIIVGFQADVWW